MNEVEKMYENAGINKIGIKRCSGIKQGICQHNCNECEDFDYKYPPFATEKQLELIKWLAKYDISIWHTKVWDIDTDEIPGCISGEVFENVLARYINYIWQDLTEEECKQIKEILE